MSILKKLKDLVNIGEIPTPKTSKNFIYFYNTGVDAYKKQDFEKAIKNFITSIEKPDVKPQVYYNLALSYQSLKNYPKAAATYVKFLEFCPNDYDGLFNIALVYFNMENFTKAISFYKKCLEIKTEKEAMKSLVLSFINNKDIDEAVEYSNQVLEKQGISTYFELAKVFEDKNSFNTDYTFIDISLEMYAKIIAIDANYFEAYLATSVCHGKKGEWGLALEYCTKALKIKPNSFDAMTQMGLLYYCRNDIKEAVKSYETALSIKPKGDYKVYSSLGYAYEKLGKYENAVKIFTQLISKFPNCPIKDEIKNHIRVIKKEYL